MTMRGRKFPRKLIPCLALAFLSAGCIKLDQTLSINKDASGSLDVGYAISEDAIAQARAGFKLKEQMAMESGKSAAVIDDSLIKAFLNPNDDEIKREIAKYAQNGIKLESLKIKTVEGWRNVKMRLTFKNLANVAKADFFQKNGFSFSKTADGNYAIQREAASGNLNPLSPDMVKLFSPMLAGFDVVLNVSVPGKILKTNAHKTSPQTNTATWSYDYDKDPGAFSAIQNQSFSIVFDGKGINLPTIMVK